MFTYAAKVDIGVAEKQNDDRALIGKRLVKDGSVEGIVRDDYLIAAICDGVGGLAYGYIASEMTLGIMAFLNRKNVLLSAINTAIEESNKRILEKQAALNMRNSLRTTIAGFYADESSMFVFNAGDSRVYRHRYKYLMQLTKDHSVVQELIDAGKITQEDAKHHQEKNIINKCIGNDAVVYPRITDYSDDFIVGDIIFICSDGVTDVLTNTEIQEIISTHKSDKCLSACCDALYSKAVSNGSKDNISIILVRKEIKENE